MKGYLSFLLTLIAALIAGGTAFLVMAGLGFGTRYDGKGTDGVEQSLNFGLSTVLAALVFGIAGRALGLRISPLRVALTAVLPLLVFQWLLWQVPWLESEGGIALLTLFLMATVGYLPFRPMRGTS